jgi:hypothetical protein
MIWARVAEHWRLRTCCATGSAERPTAVGDERRIGLDAEAMDAHRGSARGIAKGDSGRIAIARVVDPQRGTRLFASESSGASGLRPCVPVAIAMVQRTVGRRRAGSSTNPRYDAWRLAPLTRHLYRAPGRGSRASEGRPMGAAGISAIIAAGARAAGTGTASGTVAVRPRWSG